MRHHFYVLILIALLLNTNYSQALDVNNIKPISINLQQIELSQCIRLLANFLHKNVIISENIKGVISLTLNAADPNKVLDMVLAAHGLGQLQMGTMVFVATQEELIKHKTKEIAWQEINEASEKLITHIWQIHYAKAADIVHLIQNQRTRLLSKQGSVEVDVRTNKLYVRDTEKKLKLLARIIHEVDVPIKQVLIEARLISIDCDYERELGIHFATKNADEKNEGKPINIRPAGGYSLAVVKLADSSLLDIKLSALQNTGHAQLLSTPILFTANYQTASIEAGEEVPYQEVSESGGTAVTFKKAVLGLKVTPQILPDQKVLLHLRINQDRSSKKMVLGMPTIRTRQIETSVLLKSAQTVVLGGIYESNQEEAEQSLPFINQIPLLATLLKQHNKREQKRQLLIFITPKISN